MHSNPNSAALFSGEFRPRLDDKNRVTIPARWRISDADEFFLVPASDQTCLRGMRSDEFRAIGERAALLDGMTPAEHRTFLRHFYSRSQHVVADKQGRILLPEEYCKQFELRGEIVLLGAQVTFEMWSSAAWQRTQSVEQPGFNRWSALLGI